MRNRLLGCVHFQLQVVHVFQVRLTRNSTQALGRVLIADEVETVYNIHAVVDVLLRSGVGIVWNCSDANAGCGRSRRERIERLCRIHHFLQTRTQARTDRQTDRHARTHTPLRNLSKAGTTSKDGDLLTPPRRRKRPHGVGCWWVRITQRMCQTLAANTFSVAGVHPLIAIHTELSVGNGEEEGEEKKRNEGKPERADSSTTQICINLLIPRTLALKSVAAPPHTTSPHTTHTGRQRSSETDDKGLS